MSTVRIVACSRTHTLPRAAYIILLKYDEAPDALPPVLVKHRRALINELADKLAYSFSWREVDTLDTMLALPGPEAQLGADGPTWAEHLRRQDAALGLRGTLRAVLACTVREDKPGVVVSNKAGSADATDDANPVVGPLEHDALAERLLALSEKVLGHSGSIEPGDPGRLAHHVAYLERWLPQTMREREERAAAVALESQGGPLLNIARRRARDLEDALAAETRSAQAASAVADELSVALEKSRAQVQERDDQLEGLRQQVRDCNAAIDAARETVGRLMRALERCLMTGPTGGNIECECAEVGLVRAMDSYAWTRPPWVAPETPLADALQARDALAARVAELEATLAAERADHVRTYDDLRDRMSDPEGMSHVPCADEGDCILCPGCDK